MLLVGVMAKNGILIVEFADQLCDHGEGAREAIEKACAVRLRPVMTSARMGCAFCTLHAYLW
ncbi:RND multidrug efflux transporter [Rhizobium freirei PRF 81]|uniref:RND multidrug efflux transporter n=1 Tax=Rhizobium freirei PRF 81 TaxID=363754 RepID=N6V1F6_9HYPH|nr:efflux RND transporter permease subunit [Rhizobium freirei]ENN87710.1 RND multidrug efflux transporter [Rhizobium freirei PRF 81]